MRSAIRMLSRGDKKGVHFGTFWTAEKNLRILVCTNHTRTYIRSIIKNLVRYATMNTRRQRPIVKLKQKSNQEKKFPLKSEAATIVSWLPSDRGRWAPSKCFGSELCLSCAHAHAHTYPWLRCPPTRHKQHIRNVSVSSRVSPG